jgi:hypothetical protein
MEKHMERRTIFDDESENPYRRAIENGNKDFFKFESEIAELCEKYEDKLEIDDICFILRNISMNPPNEWNRKKK